MFDLHIMRSTTSSESVINYVLMTYNHKLKAVFIIRHNIIIMVVLFVSHNMNIVTFRKSFDFFDIVLKFYFWLDLDYVLD